MAHSRLGAGGRPSGEGAALDSARAHHKLPISQRKLLLFQNTIVSAAARHVLLQGHAIKARHEVLVEANGTFWIKIKNKRLFIGAMSNNPIAQELAFTPELQHAIEDLMRKKAAHEYGLRPAASDTAESLQEHDPFAAPEFELDELDRPDFDPIDYVNRMFATGTFRCTAFLLVSAFTRLTHRPHIRADTRGDQRATCESET